MAVTPGFTYDIFISYAHLDNALFPGQADGWISQFYKNLNLMLAKRFGRLDMVKIWWDTRKLDGSVLYDQSIEEGIKKSAIMICLHSTSYLASTYCLKEMDIFYNKAQTEPGGVKVGDRTRILNVLLNNIHYKKWPKPLSGTSGFPLYVSKGTDDLGDTVDTLAPEFRTQMQSIRDAVWYILNDMIQQQAETKPPVEAATADDPDAFTIFMGEVADSLRTPRKRIITELEKKGYKIVTGVPPPDEAAAHEKAAADAIKKADLAIHLHDELPGREISGAEDSWYPQKQTQLSLDAAKSQMIWVPSEIDFTAIEEENYKKFLEGLEKGVGTGKNYEFIRGSKSTLAQQIAEYAEQMKKQTQQQAASDENVSVLLDTHFKDQLYALDLSKVLLENKIQPFINPQEDDPRKNINLMGERLSQVKKLIFMYGNVSKEWVAERMSAALQLIITNNYPIEDFFIYMAPPYKEAANIAMNQRFLKVNIVDSSKTESMDKDMMQQFLKALKTTGV